MVTSLNPPKKKTNKTKQNNKNKQTNPLPSNGYVLKTRTFHDTIKDNVTDIAYNLAQRFPNFYSICPQLQTFMNITPPPPEQIQINRIDTKFS
jgi:hypothetical protein